MKDGMSQDKSPLACYVIIVQVYIFNAPISSEACSQVFTALILYLVVLQIQVCQVNILQDEHPHEARALVSKHVPIKVHLC
jgi:hypothetical protein